MLSRLFSRSAEQNARTRAKKKHVAGLVRVAAYLGVVTAGFGACSIRAARAEFEGQTVAIGRQMIGLANATSHDAQQLTLNGQSMFLGSSLATDSVRAVLDRYEAHCKGAPGARWENGKAPDGVADAPLFASGVVRGGNDDEGTVVCFVRGAETRANALEALRAFGETGQLGAFGKLRYAYAKRTERGHTVVLTAWTDAHFDVAQLAPEEGKDVPGTDFPDVPRPPDGHRVLATRLEGTPYGMNVYRSALGPAQVLAFYDGTMTERGFRAFDPELDATKHGGTGRLYEKDGVVLTVGTHAENGHTFVSVGLAGVR